MKYYVSHLWYTIKGFRRKELTRNGAVVYYGHQEAWGTIEENAAFVREEIKRYMRSGIRFRIRSSSEPMCGVETLERQPA